MRSWVLFALVAVAAAGCGGVQTKQYEYEEDLYLALDGSAVMNVNASVPALVAMRGADLNADPHSRFDREGVRAFFEGPGATVTAVSWSRRHGRRFVHVGVAVSDVTALQRLAPFAWSSYRFDRSGDVFDFRQQVGASAARAIADVGWDGSELVAFRLHLPSKIPFHNAPSRRIERGNILVWDQTLTDRLKGNPVDIEVRMEPESILSRTLLLFGATIVAAFATLGGVVWWLSRRGRGQETGPQPAAGNRLQ